MFINRLKWKTTTGEFDAMNMLVIGNFRWTFAQALDKDVQYDLLNLIENMDLYDDRAYVLIYVWLIQHDISFKLTHKWDFEESINYNLQKWRLIRAMRTENTDTIKSLKIFEQERSPDS